MEDSFSRNLQFYTGFYAEAVCIFFKSRSVSRKARPILDDWNFMKKITLTLLLATALSAAAQPAPTNYNQNFAVVRDSVPLELKECVNSDRCVGATAMGEDGPRGTPGGPPWRGVFQGDFRACQ
jgi:hypothetical protein